METTQLGRSGVEVSPICLGTMNFGPHTPEKESHAIMDHALDAGVHFFDTANVYGGSNGEGTTEEIVGRWLAQGGGRRDSIVLATKVFGPMGDGPNDRGLSAYHIKAAVEQSLRRLQTDHIDLYQMHHVDRRVPWEEIWQAMEQLVAEGKVLYVGTSNFAGWHIVQGQEAAKQRQRLGLVSEQCHYHLANRAPETDLLPACEAYGIGTLPWSPIGGGLLGGVLKKIEEGRRASDRMQKWIAEKRETLEQYEALCEEIGHKPANVAIAWLLAQPAVTAPIVGPRTMEQFEDNIEAASIELSDDVLERLDEIWPGPGGPAPEHYSW